MTGNNPTLDLVKIQEAHYTETLKDKRLGG